LDALGSTHIVVGPEVADRLATYLGLVLEANSRFNLTAVREFGDGVWLHLVDSLLGLEAVNAAPHGRLADIGSGAGFPGVPLLLVSGRQGTLIESVGKKARFLEEATASVGLRLRVTAERAELAGEREPGGYAVVTARAVAPLPSLVELAAPLLETGGRFVAYKGAPTGEELERGRLAAALVGMREIGVEARILPEPDPARRSLVSYEKTGDTPEVALPRRIGLAQKDPLA
jgi:16S rRNA (guanine527-N7)-methyltransferase